MAKRVEEWILRIIWEGLEVSFKIHLLTQYAYDENRFFFGNEKKVM